MKKTMPKTIPAIFGLLMMFLVLSMVISTVIFSGCSSGRKPGRGRPMNSKLMNISSEERQNMFEDMQQKAIQACEGKNEGEMCKLETMRGEIEGICEVNSVDNQTLVCIFDRSGNRNNIRPQHDENE